MLVAVFTVTDFGAGTTSSHFDWHQARNAACMCAHVSFGPRAGSSRALAALRGSSMRLHGFGDVSPQQLAPGTLSSQSSSHFLMPLLRTPHLNHPPEKYHNDLLDCRESQMFEHLGTGHCGEQIPHFRLADGDEHPDDPHHHRYVAGRQLEAPPPSKTKRRTTVSSSRRSRRSFRIPSSMT